MINIPSEIIDAVEDRIKTRRLDEKKAKFKTILNFMIIFF